jgi:multisubunit Na+/H+ antiporter MnhF subunit
MMDILLNYAVWAAIITHVGMVLVCVWRVWRGENIIDRLIGLDVTATLVIAVLVLISIVEKNSLYLDIAIGLAALGAISTIALAKFIADQRMF